jgi:hypothetical protein
VVRPDVRGLHQRGIRNIPARTIAGGMGKLRLRAAGDRFLAFMTERGHAADVWLGSTPLAGAVGFFWQAKCRPRPGEA